MSKAKRTRQAVKWEWFDPKDEVDLGPFDSLASLGKLHSDLHPHWRNKEAAPPAVSGAPAEQPLNEVSTPTRGLPLPWEFSARRSGPIKEVLTPGVPRSRARRPRRLNRSSTDVA